MSTYEDVAAARREEARNAALARSAAAQSRAASAQSRQGDAWERIAAALERIADALTGDGPEATA